MKRTLPWRDREGFRKTVGPVALVLGLGLGALAPTSLRADPPAVRTHLDPRVWERLRVAVETYCRDPLSRAMFMVRSGQVNLGPNMASNPGFEDVWGEGPHAALPEGEEWRRGVAHGWGITPNIRALGGIIDTLAYEKEDERLGWRSARIAHADGNLNRTIGPMIPGHAYFVQAYARLHRRPALNLEKTPEVSLSVQWWGKGWMYTDKYSVSRNLTEVGDWIHLEMAVMPPANAEQAVVFLSAATMQVGTEVLFDNLSFRPIEVLPEVR